MRKLEAKNKKSVVLGVVAGYSIASAQWKSDNGGTTSFAGAYHAGLTAELRLSNSFYLSSGLLYSAKGYNYENTIHTLKEKGRAQYIDLPVMASLRFPLGKMVKLQLNAGPYVAFGVGGKVNDDYGYTPFYNVSFSSAYGGTDYGLQMGLGTDLFYHLHIGINYQIGMVGNYRNRNMMIGIGYRF